MAAAPRRVEFFDESQKDHVAHATLSSTSAGSTAEIAPTKTENSGDMRTFLTALAAFFILTGVAAALAAGTLDTIRSRGAIIIGYRADAAPFSSRGSDR
ncbi:MAG TPA: hypothetical protein VG328_00335 [Stellaceae bacterium]|nr:hypothetical protein [Stellaceae bacterium]